MPPGAPAGEPSSFVRRVLDGAAERARAAAVFSSIHVLPTRLEAEARASASPALFRLDFDGARFWVSLVTSDRYLSQSIELDLVNTGDKLEDLLEEELVELGYDAGTLPFEHFRSEDKLFTFRSP